MTWKGHDRKGSPCASYEMNSNERAGNDNKSKTIPKGWKTLVLTTSPLRITLLGSYRRTPRPIDSRLEWKSFPIKGLARKKYNFFGFGMNLST